MKISIFLDDLHIFKQILKFDIGENKTNYSPIYASHHGPLIHIHYTVHSHLTVRILLSTQETIEERSKQANKRIKAQINIYNVTCVYVCVRLRARVKESARVCMCLFVCIFLARLSAYVCVKQTNKHMCINLMMCSIHTHKLSERVSVNWVQEQFGNVYVHI